MNKESRKEQHYAVSKDGKIIHIVEAHKTHEDYYCPNCGCHMLKRCGQIRSWHFAHDWRKADDLQRQCTYETYLHGYAKLRLKQWFYESERIILRYGHPILCKRFNSCKLADIDKCKGTSTKEYDLKKYFDNCVVEAPVQGHNGIYRADLLLTCDSCPAKMLLFEIKVTHSCTEKKRNSNVRIIEFEIKSEEDVNYIVKHSIEESDKVRFYGFKNDPKIDEKKSIESYSFQKFILYTTGRNYIEKRCSCQDIDKRKSSSLLELTVSTNYMNYALLNIFGLLYARDKGYNFQNCFLCRNYRYNSEYERYECRITGEAINKGSCALRCSNFEFNPSVTGKISDYTEFIEIIDVWNKNTEIPKTTT